MDHPGARGDSSRIMDWKVLNPQGSCWLKCANHDSYQPDHKGELTELTNKRTKRNETKRNETKQNKTNNSNEKQQCLEDMTANSKLSMSENIISPIWCLMGAQWIQTEMICSIVMLTRAKYLSSKKQKNSTTMLKKTCTITHRIHVSYIYLHLGDFLW